MKRMKWMAASLALVMAASMMPNLAKAGAAAGTKCVALPEMTESTWSQFCWADFGGECTVSTAIVTDYAKDSQKAVKVNKTVTQSAASSFACVYYNGFGAAMTNAMSDAVGVSFWTYSTASVGGGLGFKFNGVEQGEVTCYAEGSAEVMYSRDLNYEGYRQYFVPIPESVNLADVNQMELFIWGTATTEVYLSGFAAYGEAEEEEKSPFAFPEITDSTFTQFAWGDGGTATIEKAVVTENAKVGNALKMKKTITSAGNAFAAVYYQNFGGVVNAVSENAAGISFWVYNTASVGGGLGFKFGNVEQGSITCYADGVGEAMASRNLDFAGYRRYYVPIPADVNVASVNEFQIFIWGEASAEIYLSGFEVYEKNFDGEVTNVSISVAEDFSVNYYVDMPVGTTAVKAQVAMADKAAQEIVGEYVEDKALWRFIYPVAAKDYDKDVTLTVVEVDGRKLTGATATYSIKAYTEQVSSGDYAENLKTLVREVAEYGEAAKVYFAGGATEKVADGVVAAADLAAFKGSVTGSQAGVELIGATLVLESKTAVCVYFKAASLEGVNCSATPVCVDEEKGIYQIKVPVVASDLSEMQTVKIGSITVTYSAFSYIEAVLSYGEVDAGLYNVLQEIYDYAVAAKAYLG